MRNHNIEEFKRQIPITLRDINPILIIWSPRCHVLKAMEAFSKIDYIDKVFLKHFNKPEVLEETKKFMTEHSEYTHMIIVVDDVVCPEDSIEKLLRTLLIYDLPVFCGCFNWCNQSLNDRNCCYCTWCADDKSHPFLNVTFECVDREAIKKIEPLKNYQDKLALIFAWHFVTEEWRLTHIPIIKQVWFQGFPLGIIRRDIYERLGFIYDGSTDEPWARACDANDIPQFCDFSIKLKHCANVNDRTIYINGMLPKAVVFEKAKRRLE